MCGTAVRPSRAPGARAVEVAIADEAREHFLKERRRVAVRVPFRRADNWRYTSSTMFRDTPRPSASARVAGSRAPLANVPSRIIPRIPR
jgi:hypothetical protein